MAITTIGGTINSTAVTPNLDYKYGPYSSLQEAYDALGPQGLDKLVIGLTVGIIESGEITEYWFKDGINSVNDLVEKVPTLEIDDSLSSSSENPVQNKVINQALGGKLNSPLITGTRGQVLTSDEYGTGYWSTPEDRPRRVTVNSSDPSTITSNISSSALDELRIGDVVAFIPTTGELGYYRKEFVVSKIEVDTTHNNYNFDTKTIWLVFIGNNEYEILKINNFFSGSESWSGSETYINGLSIVKTRIDEPSASTISIQPNTLTIINSLSAITGTITFELGSGTSASGFAKEWHWIFLSDSTEPVITWPSGITWEGAVAPTIAGGKTYEIRVVEGLASFKVY